MLNLYKIIKTVNSNDTLTLFMTKNNINQLCIRIDKDEKNSSSVYRLNLLDLKHDNLSIPSADFTSVVTLPSNDFQKICRDMHYIAENIDITKVQNKLILKCKGDFCDQETVITDVNADVDKETGTDIIQGVFSLKYLCMFTKCTNLSNTVEIYMKNDYPLIVKYTVASMGNIKLCVCPVSND
jgi:proliferating cell nuclear antigen